MVAERKKDAWISDTVGALFDPIIVMPGGWGDTLPEWIKTEITTERLIENMKLGPGETPTGTDAEATAYLYTASLTGPIDRDWVDIYMHLMGKVMKASKKVEMTPDLRRDVITDYQKDMLDGLKRWIYASRVKARKDKERTNNFAEKVQNRHETKEDLPLRQGIFKL